MKRIEAIIRDERLTAVKQAIFDCGVRRMTVLEVRGYTKGMGRVETYRGTEYDVQLLPKTMIVVYAYDSVADEACEAIARAARTGKIGDGKIIVTDICKIIRIRTGETGDEDE